MKITKERLLRIVKEEMMIHQLSLIEGPFDSPVVAPRRSGGTIGMPQNTEYLPVPDDLQSSMKGLLYRRAHGREAVGKAPERIEGLIITFDGEGNPGISLDHDEKTTKVFLGLSSDSLDYQNETHYRIINKIRSHQLDSGSYKFATIIIAK